MQSLLLDILDKNKEEIWKSFLSLFNLKIHTTKERNLQYYDFIISDNDDYLNFEFNFLVLESDKEISRPNVKSFNKYTPQKEIYSLFDDLTGEWVLLDSDALDLNLDIPYFIDIKNKKIKIDIGNYKEKSLIYTPEKYIGTIKEALFLKLIKTNDKIKALSLGTEAFLHKVESIGFSTESLLLADKIINNSINSFNSTFFKDIINDLLCNSNYLSEFVLKSYIGTSIARSSGFKEKDIESLVKAFFLADSILPNKKSHPTDISNQIIKDRLTSVIILQHHERPEGKGFPNNLSSYQLEELSKVYIISECFYILLKKYNFDNTFKKKIIYILDEKFNDKHFRKYVHSLKYLFYKKQK